MSLPQDLATDPFPLQTAAREGDFATVQSLLASEPQLLTKLDSDSRPASFWAASSLHPEILSFLLKLQKNFDPDQVDASDMTLLDIVSSAGDLPTFQAVLPYYIKADAVAASSAPVLAAAKGHLNVLEQLASAGADMNERRGGRTPLHRAAAAGHISVIQFLLEWTPSKDLKVRKVDINAKDKLGWTPFMYGAADGRVDVCKVLLERGARTDVEDVDGQTWKDLALNKEIVFEVEKLLLNRQ